MVFDGASLQSGGDDDPGAVSRYIMARGMNLLSNGEIVVHHCPARS
jgi:hypothetical protein